MVCTCHGDKCTSQNHLTPAGGWKGTSPHSARVSQKRFRPQMIPCPKVSHRKFHTFTSSQKVISVGNKAAKPRRKNRLKSSVKLRLWRGGFSGRLCSLLNPCIITRPRAKDQTISASSL